MEGKKKKLVDPGLRLVFGFVFFLLIWMSEGEYVTFTIPKLVLLFGGLQMARVEQPGVNTKDAFIKNIKKGVKNMKKGSWFLGGGWNNDIWGGELPSASWIREVTSHHPIRLTKC